MKMHQVSVGAPDVAKTANFYRRLGLQLIVDSIPHYARLETPTGETLSVHASDEKPGATIVYFEVEDVDAALIASGLEAETGPADQPWLWREARLRDPSGNEICIYHAGANRRFPPWRTDSV